MNGVLAKLSCRWVFLFVSICIRSYWDIKIPCEVWAWALSQLVPSRCVPLVCLSSPRSVLWILTQGRERRRSPGGKVYGEHDYGDSSSPNLFETSAAETTQYVQATLSVVLCRHNVDFCCAPRNCMYTSVLKAVVVALGVSNYSRMFALRRCLAQVLRSIKFTLLCIWLSGFTVDHLWLLFQCNDLFFPCPLRALVVGSGFGKAQPK